MTSQLKLAEHSMVLIVVIFLTACPKRTPPVKPTAFRGSFGESFDYSPPITIDHNPHGGATKAEFSHAGVPIGTMFVTASPPEGLPEDALKDVIIESTKKVYGATSVKYTQITNRSGYTFHHYSSDAHHDGASYRYELFFHIDRRKLPSSAQSLLLENFGMHKFEFIIQEHQYSSVMPLLDSMIDSFTPVEPRNDK